MFNHLTGMSDVKSYLGVRILSCAFDSSIEFEVEFMGAGFYSELHVGFEEFGNEDWWF